MKSCPYCAEDIQDAAIVCKHCGRELGITSPSLTNAPPADVATAEGRMVSPSGQRRTLAWVAVPLGFVMTIASITLSGLGFMMMWAGLGFALSGGIIKRWGWGFIGAFLLFSVGIAVGSNAASSTAASPSAGGAPRANTADRPVPDPPAPKLALLSSRGYESEYGGYHYVEGQVKNVSTEPLQNVTVVATWLDKGGNFIKSDTALIEYNPILPGQVSPFKTISSGNPAMSRYIVEFKSLLGGAIGVDDQRKTK